MRSIMKGFAMQRVIFAAAMFIAVAFLAAVGAAADEVKVDSRIESVGLFKNGLAVVERSVQINGPGVYRVEDVPTPVHGTFWAESDVPVETRVTMRDVNQPPRSGTSIDFQQELVGHHVTIHFHDGNVPAVSGKVVELAPAKGDEAWDRQYQSREGYGYNGSVPGGAGQFLVLETEKGRIYANTGLIASVESDGDANVRQRRPVLLLTVGKEQKGAGTISISYLARGLGWAPSYRVNLIDDKMLSIEQQAVVKNEMEDMDDAQISLISGYPSIQFAHVISPLSLNQPWAQFFSEMSESPQEMGGAGANGVAQQAISNARAIGSSMPDLSAVPSGEGVDVHYEDIGKRTLAEGDSLALPVASGQAQYERIVEWVVPDNRNPDGQFVQEYQRNNESDKFQDSAWDAVQFKNPLPFAMTTAPAIVIDAGHFAGQRLSYWVDAGEETTLQITKALSLRTRATEEEDQSKERGELRIGGRQYRKVSVKGELVMSNHRATEINLVIRRQFSGDLEKADGDPKVVLREEGVYSVNRLNELIWTLAIKSGEEKTLNYAYTVLVAN
jgi:hypothetical protein